VTSIRKTGGTRNRNHAAITAMTIADMVGGRGVPRADDPIWMHLDGWAAELSLTAPAAVTRASRSKLSMRLVPLMLW